MYLKSIYIFFRYDEMRYDTIRYDIIVNGQYGRPYNLPGLLLHRESLFMTLNGPWLIYLG